MLALLLAATLTTSTTFPAFYEVPVCWERCAPTYNDACGFNVLAGKPHSGMRVKVRAYTRCIRDLLLDCEHGEPVCP
jgi:hypothetical protein